MLEVVFCSLNQFGRSSFEVKILQNQKYLQYYVETRISRLKHIEISGLLNVLARYVASLIMLLVFTS